MPQPIIQYGDAIGMLNEIKDIFGERKINTFLTPYYLSIKVPILEYVPYKTPKIQFSERRFKKGDCLVQNYELTDDETEEAFKERQEEGQRIVQNIRAHGGDPSKAHITREFKLRSIKRDKKAQTVNQILEELEECLSLYKAKHLPLSPRDITDRIIALLKNGSERDEAFLCDRPVEANSTFFVENQQYQGNDFINDLLKRYGLLNETYQSIDDYPEKQSSAEEVECWEEALNKARQAKKAADLEAEKSKGLGGLFSKMFS